MIGKPWKKMTKDEKLACANKKIFCGFGVFLLGALWLYFDSLPMALVVLGLLAILYGLVVRLSP